MPGKPIQEQFGQQVIDTFAEFARSDLKSPTELEGDEFSHVTDATLRRRLSEVFYGVRWIYKLGLALLTKDAERAAHVRAQIVDYRASRRAFSPTSSRTRSVRGTREASPTRLETRTSSSVRSRGTPRIQSQRFVARASGGLFRIARDFGIINSTLEGDLQWLREQRNTVHLQERSALGQTAFLNQSKKAFGIVTQTIRQTKTWKASHP